MAPLFDTHCHYNFDPIYADWEAATVRAKANDITGALVIGTSVAMSERALALKKRRPDYFKAAIGIHPEQVMRGSEGESERELLSEPELNELIQQWRELWREHEREADAGGECGLDFFYDDKRAANFAAIQAAQEKLLRAQLELVGPTGKPIIFHVRDRECDLIADNNAYARILALAAELVPHAPLVFHCFSGSRDYLQAALKFPHSRISFAGNLTFKNAADLRELVKLVPSERLLLETDAPFLAPEPNRGRSCQPWMLKFTAQVAREGGADLQLVYNNSRSLFTKNR